MTTADSPTPEATSYSAPRRVALWAVLALLAVVVIYAAFRGYLNPELLLQFANSFYC
jgi:hypothetical protein